MKLYATLTFSLFLPPVIIILPLLKTAIVIFLHVLSLPFPLHGFSHSQIPKFETSKSQTIENSKILSQC